MTRYIFVTGGVASSLGKGLAMASLGALLKAHGYKVRLRKLEPYLNVDPGTMSPYQHGEVYVTDDGAETDLDLGHYERFTDVTCRASDAVTTGMIYSQALARERRGDFLGATVQVIPHITDAIKQRILTDVDDDTDFLLVEVGGTVGDIEGLPFLEAIRQFINEVGHERALFIHLTLLPYIPSAGELKTKPSQHSVKELLHVGIQPDFLVCRSDRPIPEDAKQKLALFCNIKPDRVIEAIDVNTIYQVPLTFAHQKFDAKVLQYFGLQPKAVPDLSAWRSIVQRIQAPEHTVTIAIIAKYSGLKDAYKSLIEALVHGGVANKTHINFHWIKAEDLETKDNQPASPESIASLLHDADGILVPGGYGIRGAMGMIAAIRYAREKNIPFLGICFGMQLAVIETARYCAAIKEANSTEFGPTPEPLVGLLTEWIREDKIERRDEHSDLGGTMRLGIYASAIEPKSLSHSIYGQAIIHERHRHRYEINIHYRPQLEKAGMKFTGLSPDGKLPEMCERPEHPWFLGVQFHPELRSRPFDPHPIFKAFIRAALTHQRSATQEMSS